MRGLLSYFLILLKGITWKISPLWKIEILVVFVNTLTACDKYPVWDCENWKFPIQMQLR